MVLELAHYKLNDNAANTAVVDSINALNGVSVQNTSALTSSGKINQALSFNGTTDKVTITNPQFFNNSGTQSVSVWFYTTKTAATKRVFAYVATTGNNRVYITITTANILQMTIGNTSITIATAAAWTDNQWNHIVVVRDAANNRARAYLNGVMTNDWTSCSFGTKSQLANVVLGSLGGSEFMDGYIDDVRIYNFELNNIQVATIYNAGSGTESALTDTTPHVVVATGGIGTRAISSNYPVDEGLTAGTTKQTGDPILRPQIADLSYSKARGS